MLRASDKDVDLEDDQAHALLLAAALELLGNGSLALHATEEVGHPEGGHAPLIEKALLLLELIWSLS